MNKRTFVISELMQNNFIEETEQKVLLEETEESGKSLLKVQLPNAQKIFCIKNVDKMVAVRELIAAIFWYRHVFVRNCQWQVM